MNYSFLKLLICVLLLCSCGVDENQLIDINKNDINIQTNENFGDSMANQSKDDFTSEDELELIHEANRKNFYIWKITSVQDVLN